MPTILVVDDEPSIAAMVQDLLEEEGYEDRARARVARSAAHVGPVCWGPAGDNLLGAVNGNDGG